MKVPDRVKAFAKNTLEDYERQLERVSQEVYKIEQELEPLRNRQASLQAEIDDLKNFLQPRG